MGERTKQEWRDNRAIQIAYQVVLIALMIAIIYSFFLPDQSLLNVVLAITLPILVVPLIRSVLQRARSTEDEITRLRYSYGAAIGIILWLGLINSEFFHINVPVWIYVPVIMLIGAGAIALIWRVGQIRAMQRQAAQQKQIDQTKLEPLNGE